MTRRAEQDGEAQAYEGRDLRGALKKLAKGPMHFALGTTRSREPVLLVHRTKSARALARELKEEHGAAQATHGTASADGDALVLDVEGPRMSGMRKLVKQALKNERITTYPKTRVLVGGQESQDDEAEDGEAQGEAVPAELLALRDSISARGAIVTGLLQQVASTTPADRASLIAYCRDCGELERRARDCSDADLLAFSKSCGGRARKIAGLLKTAGAAAGAPGKSAGAAGGPGAGAPGGSGIGGSVGQGGANRPADVARVQQLLSGQGYRVAVDGKCGPGTIGAIRSFQAARGGVCDGLVEPGRNTWRYLCGQTPAKPPQYGGGAKPPQYGGGAKPPQHGGGAYGREPIPHEVEELGAGRYPPRADELAAEDSGRLAQADQVELEDGKLSGTAWEGQTPDGEVKILSGSIEGDEDGGSLSGFLGQRKGDDETETIGAFEFKTGSGEGDDGFFGVKGSAAGAKGEYDFSKYGPDGAVLKVDGGAGTASADAWVNDEGAAAGLQANVGEFSGTIGSQGTGDRDGTVRFGVSEGGGYAGRLHWADKDGDGTPEYGVGADFGPVSFDVKTEDPLRWVSENNGPLGPMNTVIGQFDDSNQTNDALKGAEDLGRTVGGIASDLFGGD